MSSNFKRHALLLSTIAAALLISLNGFAQEKHTSRKFEGVKANTGTVTHWQDGKKDMLTFSDDFKTPETPDPHIQVVDSDGNVYLLNRCMIKESMDSKMEKFNKTVEVPAYVKDIAKVQIWCAWAETLLGEAAFDKTVKLTSR